MTDGTGVQLLNARKDAVVQYSGLVSKLTRLQWKLPQTEFLTMHRDAEQARIRCEVARLDWEAYQASKAT